MKQLVERSSRPFGWRFRSIGELRKALEEYTAMMDLELGAKTQGDAGDPDAERMDARYRVMAQNLEIDRKLAVLCVQAPTWARLLHWYYRVGNSVEAEGWRVAAKRAGLPSRGRRYRGQDMCERDFRVVLDLAIRELFHVH